MAIVNKPDMNYGTWAENGNIEIPSSEKVEEGWVIEKPLNEHMNWVQNRQDKMLQYLNQRGMAEWDFRTEYPFKSYVVRDGNMYQALSQNIDSDPLLNTEIWWKPFASSGVADDVGAEIEKIKNEDGYLTHYVRVTEPIMTGACKGLAYMNSTGISGYKFRENIPVVTLEGETVATFSGGSEPQDVVTHEQLRARLQGYKIGDIYLTTSDGDPLVRLGYGTWERFGEGSALVGFSTSVSNDVPQWVKTAGSEFGSFTHKLTTAEMPNHKHSPNDIFNKFAAKASEARLETQGSGDYDHTTEETATGDYKDSDWLRATELKVGGDQPHNNVQPSIVVYMWKRTA